MSITLQKNTSLNKINDVSYMHVDNLYALDLLHFNLQMQHSGVFPLISNAPVTPGVDNSIAFPQVFFHS